jgi:hypothetical protein
MGPSSLEGSPLFGLNMPVLGLSFGALEDYKFGAKNKGISFDYPIFLLFS